MIKNLLGLALSVLIGLAAFYVSKNYVLADALVVGLILGMIIKLILDLLSISLPGLEVAPQIFIPIGLVLYGVNLKFHELVKVTPFAWLQLIVGIVVVFGFADLLSKKLKVNIQTVILTAIGTAICGAAAITMTAPIIRAKKEDIGKALLTITFLGLIGVAVYPFIMEALSMSENNYALFTATTLHQTGMVKMAAHMVSTNCEEIALSIKIVRTALIIPILVILAVIFREKIQGAEPEKKTASVNFIYFALGGFVLSGLLFSFVPGLNSYRPVIAPYGNMLWAIALSSIGLSISVKSLVSDFMNSFRLGFMLWIASITVFMFGYWVNR